MGIRVLMASEDERYHALAILDEEGREKAEAYLRSRGILREGEVFYSYELMVGNEIGVSDATPLIIKGCST